MSAAAAAPVWKRKNKLDKSNKKKKKPPTAKPDKKALTAPNAANKAESSADSAAGAVSYCRVYDMLACYHINWSTLCLS